MLFVPAPKHHLAILLLEPACMYPVPLFQKQHLVGTVLLHCSQTGVIRLQIETFVLSLFTCTGDNELIVHLVGTKSNK